MTEDERQELLDGEHLRLLRLGYLISGGANAIWALFPLIHISIGIFILLGGFGAMSRKPGEPDIRFVGLFFVIIGGTISAVFGTLAALKLTIARRIRERRSRTLCLVIAALTCLGVPYGTALGVFTLMVLGRPSVEKMFRE